LPNSLVYQSSAVLIKKGISMSNEKIVTFEVLFEAAQASLSPDQFDRFESLLVNDPDAIARLARSITTFLNK